MASSEAGIYANIYRGLRARLARAELAPGAQIRVDETARTFSASHTPVREALARLVGERLVIGDRRRGFFVPCPCADTLEQLFGLGEIHLLAAIKAGARRHAADMPILPATARAAPILLALLARAGKTEWLASGALLIERLAWARAVEMNVLDAAGEAREMHALAKAADAVVQARIVRGYHRRRRRAAGALARAIAARATTGSEYIPDMV